MSGAALRGEKPIHSIPERRLPPEKRAAMKAAHAAAPAAAEEWELLRPEQTKLPYPVWRCKVCGYLCAREKPPEVCPVCKAKQDRFERFM